METEQVPSVLDHEAFAAKYMLDLDHDIEEFRVFHWKLMGWNELKKKLTSSEFDCGEHKWRIMLYPLGNTRPPSDDVVSVYLECTSPKGGEKGWQIYAQLLFAISNPHDPTIHKVSHCRHRFTAKEPNWGFLRFMELCELFQPQPGCNRPMIEEDSTVISTYVRVFKLEDPTGALCRNFVNYDSKNKTGCVEMKHRSPAAYMNAELRFLFHIHHFRKIIYQIPTEGHHPTESIPLAFQQVSYNIQTSGKPVDTTELTKSLSWGSPIFQKFNRALRYGKLESSMKGTCAEDAVPKLLGGKMRHFIKCANIDYEELRMEEFDDIQLEVKGMKTLRDSFRDYVAVETLEGESKYYAEGLGLQDARKGIIFWSFPPVLRLQLMRSEYDAQIDTMVKINDRFEFPFEIDLDEFVDETVDRSKPWKYELHSVFVHSGDLYNGHNYVLIKPDQCASWLKFDDNRVTPVTDQGVLENSYGGELLDGVAPQIQGNHDRANKMSTNAYALAYIRKAAIDEVMPPLTEEDIPLHLRKLDVENPQMEARKEREVKHQEKPGGVNRDIFRKRMRRYGVSRLFNLKQ